MSKNQAWYKSAVFYELYVRAFRDSNGDGIGDLQGVIEKLDYIKGLGVTCIWLLPINPSPLKDGGYDISDFKDIHPEYGTLADFKDLIREAHSRGLRVVTDLVLNHTSDQHPWFQSARSSKDSPYRDFYVWSETKEKYKDARIIFIDTEESNWTWDEGSGQYYWHRFFSHQPDLNYDNPALQKEMLGIIKFWLDLGIDGFRMDAIPYLFEREGTSGENLEETISFLRKARQFVEKDYPEAALLAEANQWPEDTIPYFGDGDIMHMAFHFPLMPRIFKALAVEKREAIVEIIKRSENKPEGSQWCLFLRNHDELTLEMVTEEERDLLWERYAPEDNMRLNLGIRRRLAPLLNNNLQQMLMAYSLILTMPGSPVIYYGDEIGMQDAPAWNDRDGLRSPMQWNSSPTAGFSDGSPRDFYAQPLNNGGGNFTVEQQKGKPDMLLERLRALLALRSEQPVFSFGEFDWAHEWMPESVMAYWRTLKDEKILVIHNLASTDQEIRVPIKFENSPLDLISNQPKGEVLDEEYRLNLAAHDFLWLRVSD